ncbi:unnamed protein product [Heligmosomoides polygyrus]|uniref:Apple domain-containing protein n=1 Tax=Heligmosomoides polygyrus TaxID=6339 RepID=A0A183FC10_HELPZ|nr:unnamed protein product [Heligmosomoides polygyrus]
MISFPSSTRKPYTAAVETLRARNHRHCLEECERSPDCSSAVFSELLCEMSATRARHSVADIRPAVNQSYFEKACVDKAAVKGQSSDVGTDGPSPY